MSKQFNVQEEFANEVAQKFIKAMEEGTSIFHKGWKKGAPMPPMNPTTNNTYSGINFLNLSLEQTRYGDPRWLTFKQAQSLGAQVKKGERGTKILYWKTHNLVDRKDSNGKPVLDSNGEKIKDRVKLEFPRAFYSTVFNASQIDGLEPYIQPEYDLETLDKQIDLMIKNAGADVRHGGDRAFYSPSTDHIQMPLPQQFETMEAYQSTLVHEHLHWTGHHSRLDRDFSTSKGDESYAREELRAEIGSYMMNVKLGVEYNPERHFGYVNSWVKVLKNDPVEIVRASATAEKMTEYLLSFERGVNHLVDPELVAQKTKTVQDQLSQNNENYFSRSSTGEDLNQQIRSKEVYDVLKDKLRSDLLIDVDSRTGSIFVYKTLKRYENDQGKRENVLLNVRANEKDIKFNINGNDDFRTIFVNRENAKLDHRSSQTLENEVSELLLDNNLGRIANDFDRESSISELTKDTEINNVKLSDEDQTLVHANERERANYLATKVIAKEMFGYKATFFKAGQNSNGSVHFLGSHQQMLSTRVEVTAEGFSVSSGLGDRFLEEKTSDTKAFEELLINHLERDQNIAKEQIKAIYDNASKFIGEKSFLKDLAVNRITTHSSYSVIDTLLEREKEAKHLGVDITVTQKEGAICHLGYEKNGNKLPFKGLVHADGKLLLDDRANIDRGLIQFAKCESATDILRSHFDGFLGKDRENSLIPSEINLLEKISKDQNLKLVVSDFKEDLSLTVDAYQKNGTKLPFSFELEKSNGIFIQADSGQKTSIREEGIHTLLEGSDMENDNSVATEKIFLNVSYEDRSEAKDMGAWFDYENTKLWYVPVGTDPEELVKKFGLFSDKEKQITKDPIEQFKDALTSAGLVADNIIADGNMHRVGLVGDKQGSKNGAYALHLDQQIPGGYISNWKTGETINWRADVVVQEMTAEQKEVLRKQQEQAKIEREKATKLMYEKTALISSKLWAEASPVSSNDYCDTKQIITTESLKTVPNEVSKELYDLGVRIADTPMDFNKITSDPQNKGKDLYIFIKDSLLIPAVNTEGEIKTIQQISKMKTFARGGEKTGHFYTTDGKPVNDREIILTEGYATADAVHQITGKQVVATFDVGNLEAVAKTLREKNPTANIVIASDNDHKEKYVNGKLLPNIGVVKANEIAEQIGAVVITPPFEKQDSGTDWNDLVVDKGLEHAKNAFNNELEAKTQLDMDR